MSTSLRDQLRNEAKRLVIDATYSSRGHFAEASRWGRLAFILGLPIAIVGGLSAAGAAATALFTDAKALTALLALISAVLTSVRGFVRPEEAAESHGVKANRYVALRNDATFFLRIELNTSASDDELVKRLKGLRKSYNDLTLMPPHVVSSSAYEKAKKAIEGGEASYDNDPLWEELDH